MGIKNAKIVLLSCFCSLIFFGNCKAQLFNEQGLKFVTLFNWLESYYVDTLNLNQVSDNAIRDILHKLDPHSTYIPRDEVEAMNEPLEGNFEGIGVTFNVYKDTILIISPITGGPAEKLGILAGDRIVEIDSENVAGIGITSKQVMKKLKGPKGTKVHVKIVRRNDPNKYDFVISRDKIPIHSVDAIYKVDSNTGYIKLSRFSQITMSEVQPALKKFKDENISNLILDLSDNGGGILPVALSLTDEFLEDGKEIVYTQGDHLARTDYKATSNGLFEKGNLVIIMDEGSASASEIFAGAIQDWDRGTIVGRRSFGKGLVQRRFVFPDGAELRLTVARYYTPSGRLIQKSYAEGYEAYENELNERVESGEIFEKEANSLKVDTSLKYLTLIKNRIVYGGGGIVPDVLVPLDTTSNSKLYRDILRKGLINSFVLDYTDRNRIVLKQDYSDFQNFYSNFKIDEKILKNFSKYLTDKSLVFTKEEFLQNEKTFQVLIKAYIANNLWTSSEFYQVYNVLNPLYNKALEVIENSSSAHL